MSMNWDMNVNRSTHYWIIGLVLVVLVGLGGMMALETVVSQREAELAAAQIRADEAAATAYWLRLAAQPRPHTLPLEPAWISSGTGYRTDPMGGGGEGLHKGVDLVGERRAPVRAVMDGTVVEHYLVPGTVANGNTYRGHPIYGGYIVIDHGDGLFSCYGHLSETYVHEGWRVEAGQVIGRQGATGQATGEHLHFEIVVDPLRYLAGA